MDVFSSVSRFIFEIYQFYPAYTLKNPRGEISASYNRENTFPSTFTPPSRDFFSRHSRSLDWKRYDNVNRRDSTPSIMIFRFVTPCNDFQRGVEKLQRTRRNDDERRYYCDALLQKGEGGGGYRNFVVIAHLSFLLA